MSLLGVGGHIRLQLPWTIELMRDWWPLMTFTSILRLRTHEVSPAKNSERIKFTLKYPLNCQMTLRTRGSDMLTFHEVIKEEIYRNVVENVQDCRTIVDLGANIGLASRYFSAHYPNARIVAVEPNPDTFEVLKVNMQGRPNTKLLHAAVWNSVRALSGTSAPDHFSAFTVREDLNGTMQGIPISTILNICGEQIDLLKMDIEGAETTVFKGNVDWLRRVRCLAIEFHGDSREVSNFDEIMERYGFQVIEGKHTVIALQAKSHSAIQTIEPYALCA